MHKRSSPLIFRTVIFALVLREMQGRFGTLRMGPVFTLLEPGLHILGFALLYSALQNQLVAGVEYPVFLLMGMAPFLLLRNIALQTMESLEANRALFSYRQILPLDTFLARAIVEFSLSAAVFAFLFLGFYWYGYHIEIAHPIEWAISLTVSLAFAFGLGCIFAILAHAFPQLKIVIRLSFFPLYFLSSVLFKPSRFSPDALSLMLWNPFLHMIELLRGAAIQNYTVAYGVSLEYAVIAASLALFLGLGMYRARRIAMMRL